MGYLDWTDAEVIALTRERRREAKERKRCNTLRFAGTGSEFRPGSAEETTGGFRKRSAYVRWRKAQWKAGNRRCYYCEVMTTGDMGTRTKITVDHKHPLALGGRDDASNWAVCCWACNDRKGFLTEGEFRSLMARLTA